MKELLLYGGFLLSPDYSCIRSRRRRRWVGGRVEFSQP
jgi:uncharacterized metal-binding protein